MRGKRRAKERKTVSPPWPESKTPIIGSVLQPLRCVPCSCGGKRVDDGHAERLEVANIARDDGHFPRNGNGADHGIEHVVVSRPPHQLRPYSKTGGIKIDDVKRLHDLLQPALDLSGLGRVSGSRDLNADLDLANAYHGQEKQRLRGAPRPSQNCAMRSGAPELGNHVGIEQKQRVCSVKSDRWSKLEIPARGYEIVGPSLVAEQQLLQVRPRPAFEVMPKLSGDQDRCLLSALRHDLRTV